MDRLAVDHRAVFQIARQNVRLLAVAVVVGGDRQERPRVRHQSFALLPQVLQSLERVRRRLPLREELLVASEGVQHPRLDRQVSFRFDDLVLEETNRALDGVFLHRDPRVARQDQPPDDVGGHEVIAVAFLPPAPAAVAVLEVVEPFEALLDHVVELAQVFPAVGVGLLGRLRLDAAEDAFLDRRACEAQVLEGAGGDHRGQEAAHGLLGTAVGVVDEIGQRVEHSHGEARREL